MEIIYYTNDGINLYVGDMRVGDRIATDAEIEAYKRKQQNERKRLVEFLYAEKANVAYTGINVVKDTETYLFETDEKSIALVNSTILASSSLPPETKLSWKCWQGESPVMLELTIDEIKSIFALGMMMINTSFSVEGTFLAQLSSMSEDDLYNAETNTAFRNSAKAAFGAINKTFELR